MGQSKKAFNPGLQLPIFRRLQSDGFISDLDHVLNGRGTHTWTFRITDIEISDKDLQVKKDFSNYLIKVRYSRKSAPKIFIVTPEIRYKQAPHLYKDSSLCLYKPTLWKWENKMSFTRELFPQVCLWLYYYEVWQQTNVFFGEEAPHSLSPDLLTKILNNHGLSKRYQQVSHQKR